jgi:predicted RNase H-like HicB family nuclease
VSEAEADRYPAHVFWSEEDEGYIAVAPDLPGCSAFGPSQQEALAELQDAIASWIEAARAAGNPIPRPSKPSELANYSGKVLVRMPKSLHAQITKQARSEGVSLNQHIVFLLTMTTTQKAFEPVELSKNLSMSVDNIIELPARERAILQMIIQRRNVVTSTQTVPFFVSNFTGKAVACLSQ